MHIYAAYTTQTGGMHIHCCIYIPNWWYAYTLLQIEPSLVVCICTATHTTRLVVGIYTAAYRTQTDGMHIHFCRHNQDWWYTYTLLQIQHRLVVCICTAAY